MKPAARVVLKKTVSRRVVSAGQNVTFHLEVTDTSVVGIGHVTVCDALPSGLLYVRSSPKAHLRGGRYWWAIATLAGHHTKRFTVVANATPGAARTAVNRATAAAPGLPTAHATASVGIRGTGTVPCGIASQARAGKPPPRGRMAC